MSASPEIQSAFPDSLIAMLRPELFAAEMGLLGALATVCALGGLLLVFKGQHRTLQSGLILGGLFLVLCCVVSVNQAGNKLAVIYGCFVAYLLTSVWLERQQWSRHAGATERFLFSVPLAVVFAATTQWAQATWVQQINLAQSLYLLVLLFMASMAVIGDVQRVFNGKRTARLSRDRLRWRLCFAVHVLVASSASLLIEELATDSSMISLLLYMPECVFLMAAFYYLIRTYTDPVPDWLASNPLGGSSLRA